MKTKPTNQGDLLHRVLLSVLYFTEGENITQQSMSQNDEQYQYQTADGAGLIEKKVPGVKFTVIARLSDFKIRSIPSRQQDTFDSYDKNSKIYDGEVNKNIISKYNFATLYDFCD